MSDAWLRRVTGRVEVRGDGLVGAPWGVWAVRGELESFLCRCRTREEAELMADVVRGYLGLRAGGGELQWGKAVRYGDTLPARRDPDGSVQVYVYGAWRKVGRRVASTFWVDESGVSEELRKC